MRRTILKKEYLFEEQEIPIEKLLFWDENPRIYSALYSQYGKGVKPDNQAELQEKIFQILRKSDDVRELGRQIKEARGLTEPLIVRKILDINKQSNDLYYVLEGNRRLAACKIIHEDKSLKAIRTSILYCEVAGNEITDSAIHSLLGTLHIRGKREWDPFAKASYLRRRCESSNIDDVAREIGESSSVIQKQIDTIKLMEEADERREDRYSYYDVLIQNPTTRKAMRESLEDKERLWKAAKNWSDSSAQNFRNDIRDAFINNKTRKKFLSGQGEASEELQDAADQARESGSTDEIILRIKKFRKYIDNNRKKIEKIKFSNTKAANLEYELKQLNRLIQSLWNKVEGKLNKNG